MKKLSQEERNWEAMLSKIAIKRWTKELLTDTLPLPKNYDQRVRQTLLQFGYGEYPSWVKADLKRANNCNKHARDKKYIEDKVYEFSGDYDRARSLFLRNIKRLDSGEINEWRLYEILRSSGVMTRSNGSTVDANVMFRWVDRRDKDIANNRKKKLRELILNGLSEGKNHAIIIQEIKEDDDLRFYSENCDNGTLYRKIFHHKTKNFVTA